MKLYLLLFIVCSLCACVSSPSQSGVSDNKSSVSLGDSEGSNVTFSEGSPSDAPTTRSEARGLFLAETLQVPENHIFAFEYEGLSGYLVNLNGRYLAFSDKCTHAGCALGFDGSIFECPCHGSRFSSGGDVIQGPASQPLDQFEITVVDGRIYLEGGDA